MADKLIYFDPNKIIGIDKPERFTFPFYYETNPLAAIACEDLQNYLVNQHDFEHNFGLNSSQSGLIIGKMFGVLVVETSNQKLGYLWAYSGKLANENHHQFFVPPIFDMLQTDGFFKQEEQILNQLNHQIDKLENAQIFLEAKDQLLKVNLAAENDLLAHKTLINNNKKTRESKRAFVQANDQTELDDTIKILSEESKAEQILLKKMKKFWRFKVEAAQKELDLLTNEINTLKEQRKQKSSNLQQKLFDAYTFLNAKGETKSIGDIYNNNPPAGAGECAAPKLLHYAYKNGLKPLCMAEFWWGQSPKSEVRLHKNYYPACKSKCEPLLLNHMLIGLNVEENPFKNSNHPTIKLDIIYEDDDLLAINKPAEFLSVPGKIDAPSIYSLVKVQYPNATGPLIVHRLDMATSGLMLLAKNEASYFHLQQQFIKRRIKKTYVAWLDGIITQQKGDINLPLRVDLDDRPRQLVCYTHGKPALTHFEVLAIKNGQTKILFFPHTGRTHQLRVHAAHHTGLNAPIVGDDLYGTKSNRLHLHAKKLTFIHPSNGKEMFLEVEEPF